MAAEPRAVERLALRALNAADAGFNKLYGWRHNPFYQSGTIVTALLGFLLVTGLWLIFFYRVGDPHASVAKITANPWVGNWVRTSHRYASDAAILATLVHGFRMFAQGRSWGPRTMAWVSGIVLLFLTFVSGWTGYVMVWDVFGEAIAREGARMFDALPFLSEPVSRIFTGERPVPTAFFFLNLFAHVGIPLGMLVVLWLHSSRLARPKLLPPRALTWAIVLAMVGLALVRPLGIAPEANPLRVPDAIPLDWFYGFWIPVARSLSGGQALLALTLTFALLAAVPLVMRRRGAAAPPKSVVDESICVGCRQCALDCPYEAIEMLPRSDGRADEVARVTSDLCVSCGICAGSCAPMGVGPPGRNGRDQVTRVREFLARVDRRQGEVVAICCAQGASRFAPALAAEGAVHYPVDCTGSLHTSVIELLVRGGSAGVLVLSCPPRDCWNREGPRWLGERVYNEREAELQARVDRRRVRLAAVNASESGEALRALRAFKADLAQAGVVVADASLALDTECVPVALEEKT